jgi:nicotinic acid mononucleotide adenylyltransferase
MFVCDYDIVNKTDGKMFNTMTALMKEYNTNFRLIMGYDCLVNIQSWYKWEELAKLVPFIVVKRDGIPIMYGVNRPHRIIEDERICSASSTNIRDFIGTNQIDQITTLNPKVLDYILKHNLYIGE